MKLQQCLILWGAIVVQMCLGTQYAVDVQTFPTDLDLPSFTGTFVLPPSPLFPMAVSESIYSSISVHQSGSVHFEPYDRCCNRLTTTSSTTTLCVSQCSMKSNPQQIFTSFFPLYQPAGDPSNSANYKTTKKYFSNSTLYIFDLETVIDTTNTKHFRTYLIPPSTIAVEYIASSASSPSFSSINSFSGLITPNGVTNWPSPRLPDGSSIFAGNIPAEAVVAPPAAALDEGRFALFCSLGSSFCAHPLTIQPSDAVSITTNGDNSCYRRGKTPILAALAAAPPTLLCIFTDSASDTHNSTAIYDQLANTFKCAAPTAVGSYTLALATAPLTAAPADSVAQPLYLSSGGARTFAIEVSASAAATGDLALGGGEGSTGRYECGCAANRWALSTGGRGARESFGNGTEHVWWGEDHVNSDTYSADYCFADCSGEYGGTAVVDPCGECVGGTTGREWGATQDCNGQCGGTDTSCLDPAAPAAAAVPALQLMRTLRTAASLLGAAPAPASTAGVGVAAEEDVRTDKTFIYETLSPIDVYKYICTVCAAAALVLAVVAAVQHRIKRQHDAQTAPSPQPPPPASPLYVGPMPMQGLRPTGLEARRNIDIAMESLDDRPPRGTADRRGIRRDPNSGLVANPVRSSFTRADSVSVSRQSTSGQGRVEALGDDRFHEVERQSSGFRLSDAPSPREYDSREAPRSRSGTPRRVVGARVRDSSSAADLRASSPGTVDINGVGVQFDGSPRSPTGDEGSPRRSRTHRSSRNTARDGETSRRSRRSTNV